jgi:hypothetical protein
LQLSCGASFGKVWTPFDLAGIAAGGYMKSAEYVRRFADGMTVNQSTDKEIIRRTVLEFWTCLSVDFNDLVYSRKIITFKDRDKLAIEFNIRKGNVIVDMINKHAGQNVLRKDFFLECYKLLQEAELEEKRKKDAVHDVLGTSSAGH